jgi:phage-related protein
VGLIRRRPLDVIDDERVARRPDDWKPMQTVGPGVREIRIHIAGAHRVFYVAM